MISVNEALRLVEARGESLAPREISIADAADLVLAEDVASDIDSPPYDKALVDGYAVRAADFAATGQGVTLDVLEEVVAGAVPTRPVIPGTSTRIMTGAPLPAGADAVVMVEETALDGADETPAGERPSSQRVRILAAKASAGQNILRRAVAMRRGEVVLRAGHELRPSDIGLLAEVGRDRVMAVPRPMVAVLSTGNELVPAGQTPGPGQIRNSNGPMLMALARSAGATVIDLGIVRDEWEPLRQAIAAGLQADVLVLSGGVSAGVLDLVPRALAELGVTQVFHKVNLKPGKPLWFGVKANAECGVRNAELCASSDGGTPPSAFRVPHSEFRTPHSPTLVFGLPGNPVSSLVCFELFVRPALRRLSGRSPATDGTIEARLTQDFTHKGGRPTYHPAKLAGEADATVTPLAWQGSADLRAFAAANALIHFPAGDQHFATGQPVEVIRL